MICPVIEEHADLDWPAAEERYAQLKQWEFPDRRIALLHGRMHDEQKDLLMRQFRDGAYDILVSTQVVEVGIDIPTATVIVIEGAERFGFAQLHQLRGRVGRSQQQSYCYLISDATSPEAEARLKKVCDTDDGFALARADLQLRGPGEFFGDRQSGAGDFKVARYWDWDTLGAAQRAARQILERDSALELPEHAAIAVAYRLRWENMVTGT